MENNNTTGKKKAGLLKRKVPPRQQAGTEKKTERESPRAPRTPKIKAWQTKGGPEEAKQIKYAKISQEK